MVRPLKAPRKIPLWAWHLLAWMQNGREGPRPADAPPTTPLWFWGWRAWRNHHGRKAVRHHRKHVATLPKTEVEKQRARIVHHARYTASPFISPLMHYTMDSRRDDWLVNDAPNEHPQWTDCSGHGSQGYYVAHSVDPNGLNWKWLGWTGTMLTFAAKAGRVFTDVSRALPGDLIVIGPGPGDHVVTVLEPGRDPLVASHGGEGVQIQRLSVDPRQPKRVCQVLPA